MFDNAHGRTVFAVAAACAVAAGGGAAAANAQAPAAPGTVVAAGQAAATPTPRDRMSNASIAKAVREAQAKALPLAVAAARARALALATNAGLTLGALTGIADGAPSLGYGYGAEGTFGTGRYCGTVGRYRTVRTNGRTTRTRIGSRRVCRVPSQAATAVTLTYATAPR